MIDSTHPVRVRAPLGASAPLGQTEFFLCDIFAALPKDDLASMEHPLFSLATRPDLSDPALCP